MASGDITFQTPVQFEAAQVMFITSDKIDENRFVSAYRGGVGDDMFSIAGDASGDNITFGTHASMYPSEGDPTSILFQDTDRFISFFRGLNTSAVVGDLSGTTITLGTRQNSIPAKTGNYGLVKLTANTGMLLLYSSSAPNGLYAYIYTITGTVISLGTAYYYSCNISTWRNAKIACLLDENKVLLVYQDNANSGYGTGLVLTNTGGVISFGTPVVIDSIASSVMHQVRTVSQDKAFLGYSRASRFRARILNITGTTISPSTVYGIFANFDLSTGDISDVIDSKIVYAYSGYDLNTSQLKTGSVVLNINSDDSLTVNTPSDFRTSTSNYISVSALSNTKFVLVYQDTGAGDYGYAVLGKVEASIILAFNAIMDYDYSLTGETQLNYSLPADLDYDYSHQQITQGSIAYDMLLDYNLSYPSSVSTHLNIATSLDYSLDYITSQQASSSSTAIIDYNYSMVGDMYSLYAIDALLDYDYNWAVSYPVPSVAFDALIDYDYRWIGQMQDWWGKINRAHSAIIRSKSADSIINTVENNNSTITNIDRENSKIITTQSDSTIITTTIHNQSRGK